MSGVMDHVNLILKVDSQALSALDFSTVSDPLLRDLSVFLSNGTGANQASNHWHDQRTLTASANENLDLAGSLVNGLGQTLTFTKLKAAIFKASTGNTNSVQVTRPGANGVPIFMAAGDGIALTPGALFIAVFPDANGVAVTAGTGDLFNVANSGGGTSVTYDVIFIGVD